jgi:SsrA-binding protein
MDVCNNRKARYDYHILDTVEAGIVLQGTEVKALRAKLASLEGSYAVIRDGEVWMIGSHVEEYDHGNHHNHNPKRERKLLVKRHDIKKLSGEVRVKGKTLVPLRIYFSGRWAKVELALAQGKQTHDKRQTLKEREQRKEMKGY